MQYKFLVHLSRNQWFPLQRFVTALRRKSSLAAIALGLLFLPCVHAETNTTPQSRTNLTSDYLKKKWRSFSLEQIQKAAESGDVEAMLELCEHTRDSIDNKWLRKAAEAGEPWAQCRLGWCYQRDYGEHRLKLDSLVESVKWFRRSAGQNYPGGLYHLALCYESGEGVLQDEEKALELMRKAADQEHWYGLYELARFYNKGIGEPRNENDRPVRLLEAAAAKGQGNATEELVTYYREGIEVEKDLVMAAKYYVFASDSRPRSHPLANVENPKPDKKGWIDPFAQALSLYVKASWLNTPEPMIQIAEMYIAGNNVPRDPEKARMWLGIAAQLGSTNTAKIAELDAQLSPDKRAGMDKLVESKIEQLKKANKLIRHAESGSSE